MRKALGLALLTVAVMAGCANHPTHPLPLNGNHTDNASMLVDSVKTDLATTPVPEPIRQSSLARLTTAKTELQAASRDEKATATELATQADELVKDKTKLDAYNGRWLGDKLFATFRKIMLAAGLILALGLGLSLYGAIGAGTLASIAGRIGLVALHVIPWVGSIAALLISKLVKGKQAPSTEGTTTNKL